MTVVNIEDESESTYQIVGDDEADLKVNKISIYSPIARALVGKEIGDVISVQTPNGTIELEIFAIEHL